MSSQNELTPVERVTKCGEAFSAALSEYGCQMFTALQVGKADIPLGEIAGFPIVVKIGCDDKGIETL